MSVMRNAVDARRWRWEDGVANMSEIGDELHDGDWLVSSLVQFSARTPSADSV